MIPKILQLFRANAARPRDRRAVAAAAGQNAAIYIYDVIGYDWWTDSGITAEWFQAELQRLGSGAGDVVDVFIDSPGGDVFEARAMIAAMNRCPAQFHMHVDGLAASAASFFAMHGDRVDIIQGGFLMIHNSWTFAMGDRHDMDKQSQLLGQTYSTTLFQSRRATMIHSARRLRWPLWQSRQSSCNFFHCLRLHSYRTLTPIGLAVFVKNRGWRNRIAANQCST